MLIDKTADTGQNLLLSIALLRALEANIINEWLQKMGDEAPVNLADNSLEDGY